MDDNNNNNIYNLPLASFTFGKENIKLPISKGNINSNMQNRVQQSNLNNKKFLASSIKRNNLNLKNNILNNNNLELNNNYFDNNVSQYNTSKEEICELTFGGNNELIKEGEESNNNQNQNIVKKNNNIYISSFINNGGINDSFISVVLYAIYHMKLFRKYIINDLDKYKNFSNFQNSFLYNLREILIQIGKNKYIDIHQFRENLSKQFQNHRKFLLDQPDDPADLLFIIINAIHSNSIQFSLNEISDENCTEKCFSHKFIWLDLSRIDECKCKGSTKRLYSNHNYITDIPMDKIFNLMNNNYNNKNNNEEFLLYKNNQKLFNYYTNLISGIKTDCPVNGQRCPINKTSHKLHLANSPSYLIFNLEHDMNHIYANYGYSIMNILKCFVLIPNKFDIWDLFELNNKKNKNYFNFIGCILFKISKNYSCAFKNKKGLIIYYECDNHNIINNDENNSNIIEFVSYFDFVVFCIKNGLIPILLFYQGSFLSNKNKNKNKNSINNTNNYDDILTNEQIISLEKLSNNTDKLYKILQNKLRKKENLISLINLNKKVKNNSISLNQKNFINQNDNGLIIDKYNCLNCKLKNKITNKICIKCGYNNNEYLLNFISNKNKKLNNNRKFNNIPTNSNYSQDKIYLNYSYINKNSISQNSLNHNDNNNNNHMIIQLSKRKKMCVSPDIRHKDSAKILENYNYNTYQDNNILSYNELPMNMQYMPKKKEKQITIGSNNNKSQNVNLNRTETYINNKNNYLLLKEIKLNKKMHTSPKVNRSNNLSINKENKENNNNNNMNNKKILSIKRKNKIPLNKSNNINNYYDKQNNTIKKNENNSSSKKMHYITRTLTSNIEMNRLNKSYLNSENPTIFKNKKTNNMNNVNNLNLSKKKHEQIYKNNIYNDKDIIEIEENDIQKLKIDNNDINNIYINGKIISRKKNTINNLNLNYSYNDIHLDKRKNSKKRINDKNNKNNYNQTTFNKKKNNLNIQINTWICRYCSNINSDDYLYCNVCKKNKNEELKKYKTPINDKKIRFKIKQYKTNNSFINNFNKEKNNQILRKGELNGFNSTKKFKKNRLDKTNTNTNKIINQNQNIIQNSTKQIYNNNSKGYKYRTYNIE